MVSGKSIRKRRDVFRKLWIAQGAACFICEHHMDPKPYHRVRSPNGWTKEHVNPRARGGGDDRNLTLTHHKCNSYKSDRAPTENELRRLEELYRVVDDMVLK